MLSVQHACLLQRVSFSLCKIYLKTLQICKLRRNNITLKMDYKWAEWVKTEWILDCQKEKTQKLQEAKDVVPSINRTQAAERAENVVLSLVTLTFDLDIQTLPSEGTINTPSMWICRKYVQRLPRYFIHRQKSHRQRQKQNLTQFTVCGNNKTCTKFVRVAMWHASGCIRKSRNKK